MNSAVSSKTEKHMTLISDNPVQKLEHAAVVKLINTKYTEQK